MAWFMLKNRCTSSQEQGGGFLEIYCSDVKLSEQLRLKNIREKSSCADRQIIYCQCSPSGMTSLLSDWITRKLGSTSSSSSQSGMNSASVEDSHAKTFQSQGNMKGLKVNVRDFGLRCSESLAKYDREKSLWRTPQCLLFEDSIELLENFPKSGMTVDGQLWELTTSTHHTKEKELGLSDTGENKPIDDGGKNSIKYPTPTCHDSKGCISKEHLIRKDGKSRMDWLANFVVYGDFEK